MSVMHDQICRLCAEINQSTEDILGNNIKEMAELIYRYLSITVDAFAGISTKICLDCKEKILNFHNFALKCEHAQSFLITRKNYSNNSEEYLGLKSEFDVDLGIKQEENISDVDYFDDNVQSPLLINTEIKINPENELLMKTTPSKKRKRNTKILSSKCKTSEVFLTVPIEFEGMKNDNENNEETNGNVINISKRKTSKKCKTNTSKTLALPNKEEKTDDSDNMKKTIDNDDEEKIDNPDNIKNNQNDIIINDERIIVNGNVIDIKKPIKDVATVKEILKLSENNEVDIKKLELPPIVVQKARISQMFNFDCHMCEMKFDEWSFLYRHTKEQHQTIPEIMCVCNKKLKTYDTMIRHFRIHNPEESEDYRCDQCSKVFGSTAALKIHMTIHSATPRIFGCDQCGKNFVTLAGVKSHKKKHEPAETRLMFECSMCDRKFSEKYTLKQHISITHEKIKPFVCDLCGSSFGTGKSFRNHIQTHGEMTCMCDICNRGFKTQLTLGAHMRRVHRDNASYTCSHCNKILKTRATYKEHLLTHDEYPRFSCPLCDKKFKTPSNLKSHKRIHTGERPYSCSWCPKTFTNPSSFRVHKVQAHEIEFREYELKMLKDREEFAKKLREKLAADSSNNKTDMENNVS